MERKLVQYSSREGDYGGRVFLINYYDRGNHSVEMESDLLTCVYEIIGRSVREIRRGESQQEHDNVFREAIIKGRGENKIDQHYKMALQKYRSSQKAPQIKSRVIGPIDRGELHER